MVSPPLVRAQRGQAAVETAIILPLMTFMVLGIIQLTMLQQARLMTEYAAYQACRAGIVWNGNKDKMTAAAIVALTPTVPHTDTALYAAAAGAIHEGNAGMADVARNVLALTAANMVGGAVGLQVVRIQTIHPTRGEFQTAASHHNTNVRGPGPKELDFDDVGYFLGPDSTKFDGFAGDPDYRKATRLTIRLRYLYLMRIPFADWIIQNCWFAANAPAVFSLKGALGRETVFSGTAVSGGDQAATAGLEAATASAITDSTGKVIVSKTDYLALYALGQAKQWFFFPLVASYTMRMQSNLYVDNLD